METIVNAYWVSEAKTLIQKNLATNKELGAEIQNSLVSLYNGITSDNSMQSFNTAKQMISKVHHEILANQNESFDKNFQFAYKLALVVGIFFGIGEYVLKKPLRNTRYSILCDYMGAFSISFACGGILGAMVHLIERLGIRF